MPYSSSESIFVNPGICDNYGTQVQKFYDDEIESYVHRSGNGRQNIRTGGCSSRRGSRNLLSKMLMFSSFSSLLSSIPSESTLDNSIMPEHQIYPYDNFCRGDARESRYVQMVDKSKRVKRGIVADPLLGNSYNDVRSDESIDLSSDERSDGMSDGRSDGMSDGMSDGRSDESSGDENDDVWNLSDGSLEDIEIGEEVFEDGILMNSNYDKIRTLKYNKIIEDDEVPAGCESSDFNTHMTEEDVNESIKNLDDPVSFRDMFIVYNSFHENERNKFKTMQNTLKNLFDHVAEEEPLDEGYKKKIWADISTYMIHEMLKKDFEDFKSLYKLEEMGKYTRDEYVRFLREKKSSWNFFLRHMEAIGRNMIYNSVTRGSHNGRDHAII